MQNTDSKKQKEAAAESFSDKELQDAGQLVNIFMLAWKNYGLYPEEHTASQKAIQNLASTFGRLLQNALAYLCFRIRHHSLTLLSYPFP